MVWNNLKRGINFWKNYVVCNVVIWHVIHWLLKHIQTTLKQNSQSLPLVVIPPHTFQLLKFSTQRLFLNINIFLIILLNFPGKKKKNLWAFNSFIQTFWTLIPSTGTDIQMSSTNVHGQYKDRSNKLKTWFLSRYVTQT